MALFGARDVNTEQAKPGDPGIPFCIATPHIPQRWPTIEYALKQVEGWTQTISASTIHEQLCDGRMQVWGVLDQAKELCLVLTRLGATARGTICTAWAFLPPCIDDDAALAALMHEVQKFARSESAVALEVLVAPWVSPKIEKALASSRTTAMVLEVDLRGRPN
jgi:hypothetical protein